MEARPYLFYSFAIKRSGITAIVTRESSEIATRVRDLQ